MLDEQAARDAQQAALQATAPPIAGEPAQGGAAPTDPLVEERRRREYESLFASNVVLSRRPESQQPDPNRRANPAQSAQSGVGREPSLDDVAEAVVRATAKTADAFGAAGPKGQTPLPVSVPPDPTGSPGAPPSRQATPPISAAGPLHRVLEGTVIDAVLTNRLDGSAAAPVNCLVTNALYSHSGQHVLIPQVHECSERRGPSSRWGRPGWRSVFTGCCYRTAARFRSTSSAA